MKKILFVLALLTQLVSKVDAKIALFAQNFADNGVHSNYFCAHHSYGFGITSEDLIQCKFDDPVSKVRNLQTSPSKHFLSESSTTDDNIIERRINKLSNSQKPLKLLQRINFNAYRILFEAKGYTEMAYCFVRPS